MSSIIEINESRISNSTYVESLSELMGSSRASISYIRYDGEPIDFSTYMSGLPGYMDEDSLMVVECNSLFQDQFIESLSDLSLTVCCSVVAAKQELYRLVGYTIIFVTNGSYSLDNKVAQEISTTTTRSVPLIVLNYCGEPGSILMCPDSLSPDLCFAAASNLVKVYGCSEDGTRVREASLILGSVEKPEAG